AGDAAGRGGGTGVERDGFERDRGRDGAVKPRAPQGVSVTTGGPALLDAVRPLSRELRSHHASIDPKWRDGILARTFDDRKAELLAKSDGGELLVLLARAGN